MNCIKSQKCLFVTIDGTVRSAFRVSSVTGGEFPSAANAYLHEVESAVKMACLEQNWTVCEEPLYLYINAYIQMPKSEQDIRRSTIGTGWFAPVRPDLDSLIFNMSRRLRNIVFKDSRQICALMVRKRYVTTGPRLELFFGVPSDWEEIDNDLSYAEETSTELEKQQEQSAVP